MELFRRKNSRCWWYDFTVRGERYRGSTKEKSKTAAQAKAAQLLTEISAGAYRANRRTPYLSEFDETAEKQLLPFCGPLLRDIVILLRDTGMRPKKELFPMRIENLDWNTRAIFVPDSKTPTGRRHIPMSDRVLDLLLMRCAGRQEGWFFPASSRSGHITTIDKQFRKARTDAGLPVGLKLYCSRHDFGTEMLRSTGNLALVMRVMGQTSTKAAMQYQHPDLEQVRIALNAARSKSEQETRAN